jgi:dihydroflavonol-4-reductase
VLHVASPIPPFVPKNEDDIIIPAVNGTKFVTEAAIRNKVKRLVFTSSCLTLFFGNEEKLLTEDDWADPSKCSHYPKSKILAERALWELYNKQDLKGQHTEIVSVLPSLVLGPGMAVHGNSSEAQIAEIMKGGFSGYPNPEVNYTVVDVRDTAVGHIKALEQAGIDGQRIALAGHNINMSEVFKLLKTEFPDLPINDKSQTIEEIKAHGNPVAQRTIMLAGKKFCVDSTKSKTLLKMEYTPVNKTIL